MNIQKDFEHYEAIYSDYRKKLKKENINQKANDFLNYFHDHIKYSESLGIGIYLFDYQTNSIHYASNLIFELFGFTKKEYFEDPGKAFFTHVHENDMDRVMHLNLRMMEVVNGLMPNQKRKLETRYYYRTSGNKSSEKWVMQTNRVVEFNKNLYDVGVLQICSDKNDFNAPLYLLLNIGNIRKCLLPPNCNLSSVELSRREEEILFWSLRALSVENIAEQLNITSAGVRHHRRNILKKFESRNFAEVHTKCGVLNSNP